MNTDEAQKVQRMNKPAVPKSIFGQTAWFVAAVVVTTVTLFVVWVAPASNSSTTDVKDGAVAKHVSSLQLSQTEAEISRAPSVIKITPDATVNEDLFVFYLIEDLYDRLDHLQLKRGGEAELTLAFNSLRKDAEIIKNRVLSSSLDPLLSKLLGDYVKYIGQIEAVISKLSQIDAESQQLAQSETQHSSVSAGWTAGQFMAGAQNSGASAGDSLIGGLLLGGVQFWLDKNEKDANRKAAKDKIFESVLDEFKQSESATQAAAAAAAIELTEKHGWNRGEATFEFADSPFRRSLATALESGNWNAARDLLKDQSRIKQRSPFAKRKAILAELAAAGDSLSANRFMESSRQLFSCAELIPESSAYSQTAGSFCSDSAHLMIEACRADVGTRGFEAANFQVGKYAQAICLTSLHYDPVDATGEVREHLALAYAYSGEPSIALFKAIELRHLRSTSPEYLYNLACLLSVVGRTEEARDKLVEGLRLSSAYVRMARTDHNLDELKNWDRSIDDMLQPGLTSRVNWGVFNDDLIVTNTSAFPLTNLKITLIAMDDSRKVVPELGIITELPPAQSHTFTNCMSVSRGSKVEVTYTCTEQ